MFTEFGRIIKRFVECSGLPGYSHDGHLIQELELLTHGTFGVRCLP